MNEYELVNGKIKSKYSKKVYTIEEVCRILNTLEKEAYITNRDVERSIELQAINRLLKVENRFLTMKLTEYCLKGDFGYLNKIEDELSDLMNNPRELGEYMANIEKENLTLKNRLKREGLYKGDLL